jgi:hypothetical protein
MDIGLLEKRFALMGARLKVGEVRPLRWGNVEPAGVDVQTDRRGEFFDIRVRPDEEVEYEVADLRPDLRHLLLLARRGQAKEKLLCGHDERHWFVCAVPGASVSGVTSAMAALQPWLVRSAVFKRLKRSKERFSRRNEAFVRQGEWFFVPAPDLVADDALVLRDEPLSRGWGGKPHVCQFAYRTGGQFVAVCEKHPHGVSEAQYQKLVATHPKASRWGWRFMRRDPKVYARGRVRHKDHRTVVLEGWHRVLMNTEGDAPGRHRVVFLD